MKIFKLCFALAFVLSMVASPRVDAAENPARAEELRNARRILKGESARQFYESLTDRFEIRGHYDGIADGHLVISEAIAEETRRHISEKRRIPLSRVRKRTKRYVRLLGGVPDGLRDYYGQPVVATLRMSPSGVSYLVGLRLDRD